jgi:hypothetical protein
MFKSHPIVVSKNCTLTFLLLASLNLHHAVIHIVNRRGLLHIQLREEALEQAVDHQVALLAVEPTIAVVVLKLFEVRTQIGHGLPVGRYLTSDLGTISNEIGDQRYRCYAGEDDP